MKYSDNYEFSLPSKADGDSADIDPISENFKQIDSILKNIYTKLASQIVFLAENEISLETSPEDIPYGINVCFVNKSSFVNGLVQIGTLIALKNENLDRHTYQVDEFWIGNTTLVPMQRKSVKTDEGEKVWQEWQRLATEDTVTAYINSFAESENIFKQHILEKLSEIDKRTVNLEQGITPSPFETDDTVAYSKIVPENALPYAEISKVGGMTRKCTNLIPYPYIDTTKTTGGMTFTDNGDGTVTANGTYDSESNFVDFVLTSNLRLPVGIYTVKGIDSESGTTCRVLVTVKHTDGTKAYYSADTFNLLSGDVIEFIVIRVFKAVGTLNNVVFKPMLNEGTTALPYEPYFEGLRSAPVSAVESVGVNLFDGIWEKGFINASGNVSTDGGIYWRTKNYIYTPSEFVISSVASTTIASVFVMSYDNEMKYIRKDGFYNSFSNVTYSSLPENTRYIRMYVVLKASTNDISTVFTDVKVELGTIATPYTPYVKNTLEIPEAVQALDGYGEGNPDDVTEYNYVDLNNGTYHHVGDIIDGAWAALATSVVTDISDILTADNYIGVESGGTVTMANEHGYDVPSEITYQIKGDAI